MISWLFVTAVAAPPTGFTQALERVALTRPVPAAQVQVDPVLARIIVTQPKILKGPPSTLCPTVIEERDRTILRCTSRRLWATTATDKNGPYLDVRLMQGVPPATGGEDLPLRPWPLRALGIPEDCPGKSKAPRGECLLAHGQYEEAEALFTEALGGPDTPLARVRLGDLAIRRGDWETALEQYALIPPTARPIGRMARARSCTLIGTCLSGPQAEIAAELAGLTGPLRAELVLATLRRDVAAGHVEPAITRLAAELSTDPALCDGAQGLCQRLAQVAMETDDDAVRMTGLRIFLTDGVREGPHEAEVSMIAAQAAEALGAPRFAGALYSAATPLVAPADLEQHLLKTAQLFLAAKDPVRANVILDYAESKLRGRTGAAWAPVRRAVASVRGLKPKPAPKPAAHPTPSPALAPVDEAQATAELAKVAILKSRATAHTETSP